MFNKRLKNQAEIFQVKEFAKNDKMQKMKVLML